MRSVEPITVLAALCGLLFSLMLLASSAKFRRIPEQGLFLEENVFNVEFFEFH